MQAVVAPAGANQQNLGNPGRLASVVNNVAHPAIGQQASLALLSGSVSIFVGEVGRLLQAEWLILLKK